MFGYCTSDPDIPIEHLDYKYIETCTDANKLQRILKILRSGEEGRYPDLEAFAEKILGKINPESELLEKKNREKLTKDLSRDEKGNLFDNIKDLLVNEESDRSLLKELNNNLSTSNPIPIRSSSTINCSTAKSEKKTEEKQNKRVLPKSYDEWAKIDKELELNSDDVQNKENLINNEKTNKSNIHEMIETESIMKKYENVPLSEKKIAALNEKNKGNEAFRSGDFKEALVYYNRSLSIKADTNVFNNRAITYLKLEKFKEALQDADFVIKNDDTNLKAYLRRGLAYHALKNLENALKDFTKVVELDPKNKRGKELYEKVYKEIEKKKEDETTKKKGRRLVIEEIDNNESKSDRTQINHDNIHRNTKVIEEKLETSVNHKDISGSALQSSKCANMDNERSETNCEVVINAKSENEKSSPVKEKITIEKEVLTDREKLIEEERQKELPKSVCDIKNEANDLFRNGAYPDAREIYTKAIHILMEEPKGHEVSLATLFSNRAACELKSGHCGQSIKDCTKSIQFYKTPKAYLRRASAYETLEKYIEAYIDFKAVASASPSTVAATQALSRISSLLRSQHGSSWRDKIPKQEIIQWSMPKKQYNNPNGASNSLPTADTKPETTTLSEQNKIENSINIPNTVVKQTLSNKEIKEPVGQNIQKNTIDQPLSEDTKNCETSEMSTKTEDIKTKEDDDKKMDKNSVNDKFVSIKTEGNKYVQKGKYEDAIPFYNKCIELLPHEVSSYTNRALCYLKLNKFDDALKDCDSALNLQADNVKALFRRAQASKRLKQYRQAIVDLTQVLKLEPENKAAKEETNICKELFRKELKEIQEKNAKEKAKKIKIEEVQSTNKPSPNKMSTKATTCPTAKHTQQSKSSAAKSKNISSYEFFRALSVIKSNNSSLYADVLQQIEPEKLPELLSNKLDESILRNIIHAVSDHFTKQETFRHGLLLLRYLCQTARFKAAHMMLSKKDQSLLRQTCSKLETLMNKEQNNEKLRGSYEHIKKVLFS